MEVWVRMWEGGRERLRLNGSVGEEVGGREREVEVEWKCG